MKEWLNGKSPLIGKQNRIRMRLMQCLGILACVPMMALYLSAPMRALREMPAAIRLPRGAAAEDTAWQRPKWLTADTVAVPVSQRGDERLTDIDRFTRTYRLFGVVPIKTVEVLRTDEVYLVPGGAAVGITIHTRGVMVVGLGAVDTAGGALSPGSVAGIRAGDVIVSAGGVAVRDAEHLMQLSQSCDGLMTVTLEREGTRVDTAVRLVADAVDGALRMGLWVRDSTAGVGTLSFYDAETGWFAALGHPVNDVDTQSLLPVGEGKIVSAEVLDVRTGAEGYPGELVGVFDESIGALGDIRLNTEFGVFGPMRAPYQNPVMYQLPLGYAYEAHTGAASILATVSDVGVQSFSCEIIRVNAQSNAATKGMIVQVTDEKLMAQTGGIVQGMSGCPLIQDGKLVGVVTHVFVNDPTRGYCVYAEWMREILLGAAKAT